MLDHATGRAAWLAVSQSLACCISGPRLCHCLRHSLYHRLCACCLLLIPPLARSLLVPLLVPPPACPQLVPLLSPLLACLLLVPKLACLLLVPLLVPRLVRSLLAAFTTACSLAACAAACTNACCFWRPSGVALLAVRQALVSVRVKAATVWGQHLVKAAPVQGQHDKRFCVCCAGIVIGETAVVGENVSMLHHVSLGGSGTGRGEAPCCMPMLCHAKC